MNTKEKITLSLLTLFYLFLVLLNVRYFPDDIVRTLIATGSNILTLASAAVAMTLIIVTIMQKVVGERLPWDRVFRFYLLFAILIWAFAIVYTFHDGVERQKDAQKEVASTALKLTVW